MPVISGGKTIEGSLGTPLRNAGVPVNGAMGTQVGAAVGALLIDITAGQLYQNTGTPAAPVWTKVGTEA